MALDQSSGINRRVLAIVIALVVAVASVVGLFLLVQSQSNSNGSGNKVGAWVTTDQLVAGATITTNDVHIVQFDSKLLPTNYLDSSRVVVGQTMVVAAAPGTVLTQTTVSVAQLPALTIPNDWVAMAIPNTAQLGVAGYVQAGDHIDIIADASKYNPNPGATGAAVRYVLQDVEVLKAGPAGSGASAGGLLVVALPRAQAEELAFLDSMQPTSPILSYVLRNSAQSSKIDPHTGMPEPQIYLTSGSITPNNPSVGTVTLTVTGHGSNAAAALKAAKDAQTALHSALVKANFPDGSIVDGAPTLDYYALASSPSSAVTATATVSVPGPTSDSIDVGRKFGATIGISPGNATDEQITANQLNCLFPASGSTAAAC